MALFRYDSAVHAEFSESELQSLARTHYGIEGRAAPLAWLPTNTDRPYRIDGLDGATYVLRISRVGEDPAVIALQHRAIERVAQAAPFFALPRIIADRRGRDMVPIDRKGKRYYARLHVWVPGRPIADLPSLSRPLARDFGRVVGTVAAALDGFEHPAPDRIIEWDLLHGRAAVESFLPFVDAADQRALIDRVIGRFDRRTAGALAALRRGIVHSDLTGYNVLFDRSAAHGLVISGIIDFGDCVRSAVIGDLVAALSTALSGRTEHLAIACEIVKGAAAAFALCEDEADSLFDLVALRLAVGVSSLWQQHRMEAQPARLQKAIAAEWRALQALAEIDPDWATACFRTAAGLDALPSAPRIKRWLAANAARIVPPVEAPGTPVTPVAIDLSPASPVLDDGIWEDPDGARAAIARTVAAQTAPGRLVLGRHDEPRLIHARTGSADEPASVHFGLDLFAPEGTPVRSPLPGTLAALGERRVVIEARAGDDPVYIRFSELVPAPGLVEGAAVEGGTTLGRIARPSPGSPLPAHLHIGAAPAAFFGGDIPALARPTERAVWRSLSIDPAVLAGLPSGSATAPRTSSEELAARRDRSYARTHEFYYRHPPLIVRGWMHHLYDSNARPLLDMLNNVAHVGHGHPRVVDAIARQIRLLNTNARYLHGPIVAFAEALAARFPDPLDVCFFCSSGSEANELALKIALTVTGRRGILGVEGNYHGNTLLLDALADMGAGLCRPGPAGTAVAAVPVPASNDPDEIDRCLARVDEQIDRLARNGPGIGALIAEMVVGAGRRFPPGYLAAVAARVRAAGGLVIVDEIQTGMGRMGEAFSAFDLEAVVPDLVTLGKPIGNGYPLSAVVADRAVAEAFSSGGSYFATFGGNPVACAAGHAVLQVIEDENLMANAAAVGRHLEDRLRELRSRCARIGDSYGIGLYRGVEIVHPRTRRPDPAMAMEICERLREAGINTYPTGGHVLKIKPPLSFTLRQADAFIDALGQILPGLGEI